MQKKKSGLCHANKSTQYVPADHGCVNSGTGRCLPAREPDWLTGGERPIPRGLHAVQLIAIRQRVRSYTREVPSSSTSSVYPTITYTSLTPEGIFIFIFILFFFRWKSIFFLPPFLSMLSTDMLIFTYLSRTHRPYSPLLHVFTLLHYTFHSIFSLIILHCLLPVQYVYSPQITLADISGWGEGVFSNT